MQKASISRIQRIVAVASGKGGVGKSTTAANIAAALSSFTRPSSFVAAGEAGELACLPMRVGLLDADIYGPSIPMLMGLRGLRAQVDEQTKMLLPLSTHGIKSMSMGFLVAEEDPIVWRGLMVMSAIKQLLFQVEWGGLDVLVIDMPPGTGDTQLSITQELGSKLSGAVIVSTPQDLALLDARKGVEMFKKVNVPNMSHFVCPHCHERTHIFGHNGVAETAKKLELPFLGDVPLEIAVREQADQGLPIVFKEPNSPVSAAYTEIALQLKEKLFPATEENRLQDA